MNKDERELVEWYRDQCVKRYNIRYYPQEHALLALIDRLARIEEKAAVVVARWEAHDYYNVALAELRASLQPAPTEKP